VFLIAAGIFKKALQAISGTANNQSFLALSLKSIGTVCLPNK
jgi:hypothetical protein